MASNSVRSRFRFTCVFFVVTVYIMRFENVVCLILKEIYALIRVVICHFRVAAIYWEKEKENRP